MKSFSQTVLLQMKNLAMQIIDSMKTFSENFIYDFTGKEQFQIGFLNLNLYII